MIVKETAKDFKPMPAGSHIGRCFAVIDLGTQNSPNFPAALKVMLMFEVPGETIEIDGVKTPMTIQREYTQSLSEKANLRHHLESWRGRQFTPQELVGFKLETIIGHPCMLSVIHKANAKGRTYAVISGISGLPKGVICPPQFHKSIQFEIDMGKHEAYVALPEWLRKKVDQCEEWVHPLAAPEPEPEPDLPPEEDSDNVPFNLADATLPKKHVVLYEDIIP